MGIRTLSLALAVSAAFNLGFIGTAAYRCYQPPKQATSCVPASSELSPRIVELSARLDRELEPLRQQQAEHTHRLAELMAAERPNSEQIELCLDQLAATGRSVHGLVVDTVLAQREILPEDQRINFCNRVQRRLCDPWAGCEPSACGAEDHDQQPEN